MKFNRLNEDKLQIIISRDDLQQRDMKRWDLVPYNPTAQKLFQDILEEAYEACGFEVGHDAQLMIEAYPMTGESMIITITKINDDGKKPLDFDFSELEDLFLDELLGEENLITTDSQEVVYMFAQLEDAIQLAKQIYGHYEGTSDLFKCGKFYYMVIKDITTLEDKFFGFLSEYGELISISPAYLAEHGQSVIDSQAIEILAGL